MSHVCGMCEKSKSGMKMGFYADETDEGEPAIGVAWFCDDCREICNDEGLLIYEDMLSAMYDTDGETLH